MRFIMNQAFAYLFNILASHSCTFCSFFGYWSPLLLYFFQLASSFVPATHTSHYTIAHHAVNIK